MQYLWAYLLVVFLVAFEGEATILLAAGAASAGYLNPFGVLFAVTIGNVVSDVGWYALGYYSKVDWLVHRLHWLGITVEKVNVAKHIVRRDAVKLLIFSKLTNWITIPALIATGLAKVPWKRWFPLIVISNFLIGAVVMSLGYFAASNIMRIQSGLRYVALGFTLLFILVTMIYIRRMVSRKNFFLELEQSESVD